MVHLVHQVWEIELFISRVIFLVIGLTQLSQSLSKLIYLPFQIAVAVIASECLEAVVTVSVHHIAQSVQNAAKLIRIEDLLIAKARIGCT